MAILTRTGRAAIAKALKAIPSYLAWGVGDGAWSSTIPPENPDATALIEELGRRKATSVDYVTPDENGDIQIPGAGKFSVSATPTRQLVYTFKFDFAEASDQVIRELAIFINVQTDPDLPVGQMYFTPDEVVEPGDMLQLEHRAPIERDPGSREIFQLLVTL